MAAAAVAAAAAAAAAVAIEAIASREGLIGISQRAGASIASWVVPVTARGIQAVAAAAGISTVPVPVPCPAAATPDGSVDRFSASAASSGVS